MKSKGDTHIESFTIMNVLVGMTLTGLLVGFIYTIQTNMSQMQHGYTATHTVLNDYEIAKADLKRNVEAGKEIQDYPHGFSIINNNGGIVSYFLDGKNLLKKTKTTESILFNNVSQIDLTKSTEENETKELITSISIIFLVAEQELPVHLYSLFDSKYKLNQLLIHES